MPLSFHKMHANGDDFVIVDARNSANHNARSPSSLLSQTVAPRTARASRGNALVAQRIERRFPKPGAAGPTPAMGTMPC